MNEDMTAPNPDGSDHADITSDTAITDFTQVVSCALGNDRETRRRDRIREELVREHFAQERIDRGHKTVPTPRSLLLKLFKLN